MENHILIVDDNLNNLRIAVDILMSEEYKISTARSGQEALSVLAKAPVDLILLDINMPDMNGFEVTQQIKQNDKLKDIPILFVTSHSDEIYLDKAFKAGCVDFIAKPYRPTEFISRIKTHLALTNHQRNLESLVKEKTHELENTIEELKVSKRAKEDFISVMSHELRTPLSGILGMIELLKLPDSCSLHHPQCHWALVQLWLVAAASRGLVDIFGQPCRPWKSLVLSFYVPKLCGRGDSSLVRLVARTVP